MEPLKKIAGAGAAWEGNQDQEPEPLEKKSGAGARATKKFDGSPALFERYHKYKLGKDLISFTFRSIYLYIHGRSGKKKKGARIPLPNCVYLLVRYIGILYLHFMIFNIMVSKNYIIT